MFAYLILLHDPTPHPLLCVEEPENQLHPDLLAELAEEFREYADRGGQVFVSTHSPDLLNGSRLDEVFWLSKQDGFTVVRRAKDDARLRALVESGELPGSLWKRRLFDGEGPRLTSAIPGGPLRG
jgi:predicted ATPase